MFWNLIVDPPHAAHLRQAVTVEADSWHSALESLLRQQGDASPRLTNLMCALEPDQSVTVSDFVSKRVYRLKPFDPSDSAPPAPAGSQGGGDDSGEPTDPPPTRRALIPHSQFFEKDEISDDITGVFYRERRLSVDTAATRRDLTALVMHYFEQLRRNLEDERQRFITIKVYEQPSHADALVPALAALTWKSWRDQTPDIAFPKDGEASATFEKPGPDIETPDAGSEPDGDTARPLPLPAVFPEAAIDVEERIITAFERMQGIYGIHDHDTAAEFILSLAAELIPAGAGVCMLVSTKRYEFYISAVVGELPPSLRGATHTIAKGVVGFSATNSAVVAISSPENDPRFDRDIDIKSDVAVRNLLVAPIQFEGETVGAIQLMNSGDEAGFSQNDANLLSYLASSFGEFATLSLPPRQAKFTDKDF